MHCITTGKPYTQFSAAYIGCGFQFDQWFATHKQKSIFVYLKTKLQ